MGRSHMAASRHQMQYRNYDHNWHQVQSGNWGVLSNRIGVVTVKTFLRGGSGSEVGVETEMESQFRCFSICNVKED